MKKATKFFAVTALAAAGLASITACSNKYGNIKLGLILLHPRESSTYDKNFYEAVDKASKELGFKFVLRENVPENDALCTTTANELVDEGCNIIFGDSFGHEDPLLASAATHPEVTYLHATGTQGAGSGLSNFFNAFANIYEGRYAAGVAAGKKLESMIASNPATPHKVGYVGAKPYAEVKSGYTAWYLGVKSVVSDVTMDVTFTNEWYEETLEKNAANSLIARGCALISQHADSYGAPQACEAANPKVPNVTYNYPTDDVGPNTYLTGSKIDWSVYVKHAVQAIAEGKKPNQDFCSNLADGGVKVFDCSANCPAGTQEAVNTAINNIKNGTLKVFDTSKFTVNNAFSDPAWVSLHEAEKDADGHITKYLADCKSDAAFTPDTQVIKNGEFSESTERSAPYFDIDIDGITIF